MFRVTVLTIQIIIFINTTITMAYIPTYETESENEIEPEREPLSKAQYQSYNHREQDGPGTYAFGYDIDDEKTGNTQFRDEQRYPNGTVAGSYGYVDPTGTAIVVHYVADHLGYRARVERKKPRWS